MMRRRKRSEVAVASRPGAVVVQGEPVVSIQDILESPNPDIAPIASRLALLEDSIIGPRTRNVASSQEITILADRSTPFTVVKRIMSTCTNQGYGRISLAVIQKSGNVAAL